MILWVRFQDTSRYNMRDHWHFFRILHFLGENWWLTSTVDGFFSGCTSHLDTCCVCWNHSQSKIVISSQIIKWYSMTRVKMFWLMWIEHPPSSGFCSCQTIIIDVKFTNQIVFYGFSMIFYRDMCWNFQREAHHFGPSQHRQVTAWPELEGCGPCVSPYLPI